MKVLYIVSSMPSDEKPAVQPFVKTQIMSVRNLGIDTEVIDVRGAESRLNYLRVMRTVRKLAERENFDLIHGHYVYSGFVAASQRYAPSVVSFMGSDINGSMDPAGRLTFRGALESWMSRRLQRHVDGIVVKTRDMMSRILYPGKAVVIPNGVDFNTFRPMGRDDARRRLGLSSSAKYILFAGNAGSENKGHEIASEAVSILRRRDDRFDLLTVSGLPQEEVALFMNAADVLVLPSRKEGSPNVIKEALACDLPVVATDVGDVAEMISGMEGCSLSERNAESFASAVSAVLSRGSEFRSRERIGHLRIENVASRLLSFYERVIREWSKNHE